jgi:hypothetical protein
MYEMGCFTTNGFYPSTSTCSSNTSSPDSLKHQRLLIAATPSPPNVSHQYFQPPQQYLFDHPRFHFNNTTNNNNNNNSNSNGSSEIHSSSSSTTSSHDQLHSWFVTQSSGQQQQSTFFEIKKKRRKSFSLIQTNSSLLVLFISIYVCDSS